MSESREQRIMALATTLKSSGIAKTDSQAKMMAEDMIGVEEHVQKDYEVEHKRATEYLQTAKNLGASKPRPQAQQVQPVSLVRDSPRDRPKPVEQERKVAESVQNITSQNAARSGHDTGNSMIEAIKDQMSKEYIKPLYDQYEESLNAKASEQQVKVPEQQVPVPEKPKVKPFLEELKFNNDSEDVAAIKESVPVQAKLAESTPTLEVPVVETPVKEEVIESVPSEPVKLDAQKLIDLMEEDGNKMEEHTREIKEKPKNIKPKEAYEENNIDLAAIFGAKK